MVLELPSFTLTPVISRVKFTMLSAKEFWINSVVRNVKIIKVFLFIVFDSLKRILFVFSRASNATWFYKTVFWYHNFVT